MWAVLYPRGLLPSAIKRLLVQGTRNPGGCRTDPLFRLTFGVLFLIDLFEPFLQLCTVCECPHVSITMMWMGGTHAPPSSNFLITFLSDINAHDLFRLHEALDTSAHFCTISSSECYRRVFRVSCPGKGKIWKGPLLVWRPRRIEFLLSVKAELTSRSVNPATVNCRGVWVRVVWIEDQSTSDARAQKAHIESTVSMSFAVWCPGKGNGGLQHNS